MSNQKILKLIGLVTLSLAAILLLYFGIELITDYLYDEGYTVLSILSNATMAVAVYFLVRILNKKVNGLSVSDYGFTANGLVKNFLLGVSITIGITSVILLSAYLLSDIRLEFIGLSDDWLLPLIEFTMIHLVVGIWEEMYFRGLLVNTLLKKNISFIATGILTSLLFTLLHFFSFDLATITPFWMIAVFCLSQVLLYSYILTRSIWTPIGIHFSWDFIFTSFEADENDFGLLHIKNYEENTLLIDNITVVVAVIVLVMIHLLMRERLKEGIKRYVSQIK